MFDSDPKKLKKFNTMSKNQKSSVYEDVKLTGQLLDQLNLVRSKVEGLEFGLE